MTILRNDLGVPFTYELAISGVAVNYASIDNIDLMLSEDKHDVLTLDYKGIHPRAITEYINAPVRFVMETGPGYQQVFVGYVTTCLPVARTKEGLVNESPFQAAQISCFGMSYTMRGKRSRSWEGHTLPQVATTLAKQYRFSVDVPNDPLVIGSILQTNESDWQFLVRYANTLGYKVTCHGTHLHVFDPHMARDRSISLHTLVGPSLAAGGKPMPGFIMQFDGDFQLRNADGDYMDAVVGVTYPDGTTFDVRTSEVLGKASPASFEDRLVMDVDSYAEAQRLVQQVSRDKYDYYAEVNAIGIAGCVPGGMVKVTDYKGGFDGWWYVRSIHHRANSSAFTSELCIARNRNSSLESSSGVALFRTPPLPGFVDNQFRASRTYYNVY